MQFEYNHKIGNPNAHVKFLPHRVTGSALISIIESLFRIGGEMQENVSTWTFPMLIPAAVISQIIANTCFQCGGLMKDSERIGNLTTELPVKRFSIRRCSACGHSHT